PGGWASAGSGSTTASSSTTSSSPSSARRSPSEARNSFAGTKEWAPKAPPSLRGVLRGAEPPECSDLRVVLRQPPGHARHDLAGHAGGVGQRRFELPAAEHARLHRGESGDGGVAVGVDEECELPEE